jgi:hypothetical protein
MVNAEQGMSDQNNPFWLSEPPNPKSKSSHIGICTGTGRSTCKYTGTETSTGTCKCTGIDINTYYDFILSNSRYSDSVPVLALIYLENLTKAGKLKLLLTRLISSY